MKKLLTRLFFLAPLVLALLPAATRRASSVLACTSRFKLTTLSALLSVAVLFLGSFAQASGSDGVEEKGCRGVVVSIRVPRGNVEPLVPEPFVLVEDNLEPGKVRLDIIMQKCDQHIINGHEHDDVIFAHPTVDVTLTEPDPGAPPPNPRFPIQLIQYQLWLVTNNPDLVEYLHDRGATPSDVRLVSDLVYDEGADGSVRFKAPPPTPSPFEATAQLGPRPVVLPIAAQLYRAVPGGAQRFDIEHDIQLGLLTDWTIEPQKGSQLDVLLCRSPRNFVGLDDESLNFSEPTGAFFSVHLWETDVGPIGEAECTEQGPTAVTVSAFTVRRTGASVVLRWQMASELDTAGFNVYRERLGRRIKLNRVLIAATPSASRAGRYSWRDRHPARGAQYFLEELRHDGERVWHGPVAPAVAASAGGLTKGGRR